MYIELFASLLAISLLSFIGLFTMKLSSKQIDKYLEYMVAFAIGALLGDVFIHLLPELVEDSLSIEMSLTILAGIVTFFILEKVVHWHHCHHTKHGKECSTSSFSYMSLMGDVLHNFIDGIILAGAFLVNPVVGFSTAVAIALHEIPQEVGDFGVLLKGGFTRSKAMLFNFLVSLTAFAGAIFALIFSSMLQGITPFFIAFAIGSFLYIAGTDLFPELHKGFSAKKAVIQLFFILLGIALMGLLLLVG